jgi:uncharacterized delta-60 repeat protein
MFYMRFSRTRSDRVFIAMCVALLLFSNSPLSRVQAAPGDLDPSFGSGGKIITNIGGLIDIATSVAIQPDGKILAGGTSEAADFALVRYRPDGSLDDSFGSGGIVITDLGTSSEGIEDIVLQPDGKIVAAGFANFFSAGTQDDFAVTRYNSDGSLDTSFGSGGIVSTDFFRGFDQIKAVALQPDGRIVTAGFADISDGQNDFALARYNSDGSLDTTFGAGGTITTDFGGGFDRAEAIALQTDGKIVAAGIGSNGFALARYNSDGSLDESFGTGGKVISDLFGGFNWAFALAIQSNGKIIAAGQTSDGTGNINFGLARYNTDGSFDLSFGVGGKVSTDFFGKTDSILDIAFEPNGKIVAAGLASRTDFQTSSDFALARYNIDGSLDSTFGSGGKITTDFLGRRDEAQAIAIQSDGKIVAAGLTQNSLDVFSLDFALARYNGDGPSFDVCLQDDRNGNLLLFNSQTGDYQFSDCRKGFTLTGRGAVRIRFCKIELRDSRPDRNLSALANTCVMNGSASLQVFSPGRTFTISDSNTANNTCACR